MARNREVTPLLEAGPEVHVKSTTSVTMAATQVTDFIWAVRVAKITKNGLQSDWKMETLTGRTSLFGRGAVFTPGQEKFDVQDVLSSHGMEDAQIVREPGTDFLVIAPLADESHEDS